MTGSIPGLWPATATLVAAALILGGGTSQALWSDALLQIAGLGILLLVAASVARGGAGDTSQSTGTRLTVGLLIGVLAIAAYELMPLPPAAWTMLPGRAGIVEAYRAAGIDLPWQPISLRPAATWWSLVSLIPAIAIFAGVVRLDRGSRRLLTLIIIAMGLISVFVGLAQLMQGSASPLRFFPTTNVDSSVGFFANRNHYAALLTSLIPFVIAWIVEFLADRGPGRILGLAAFLGVYVILVLGLGMALSRAGIVLAVVATFASLLMFLQMEAGTVKRSLTIMGAAILIGAVLITQFALFGLLGRFSADPLADSRVGFAATTVAAAADFAPVGSGLGTFVPIYKSYETPDTLRPTYVYHAHNDWLEIWLELGWTAVVVVLAFLVWFVSAVTKAWRPATKSQSLLDRCLPQAASITVVLLLLHSVVDYPLRTTALSMVLALSCALMVPPPRSARATAPVKVPGEGAHRGRRRRRPVAASA